MSAAAAPAPRRRGLVAALLLAAALFMVVCGLALYAFMLNVDLGEAKRRLSKEVETRQQTERYLTETRNQLLARQREVEQLRQQLSERESDYQSAVAVKPELPVTVGFRASLLGKGLVAVIQNTGDRYLTVVLSVRNPTLATAKRFTLELEPRASTSFGHLEGWQFASGDEFALYNDEFAALRLTVP
jgi:hypothetical protein